jgi:hypothetical protein
MKANNIKFRCSELGQIMTDSRSKSEPLSETAKSYCIDVYIRHVYDRHEKEVMSKYIEKGNAVEEDAITMLSLLTKNLYLKNNDIFENDYIKGVPDLFIKNGQAIEVVEDIKSSWDLFTFTKVKFGKLSKNHYWQMVGYMWLTGAKKAKIRYCLVNATDMLLDDEKRRLAYAMGAFDNDDTNTEYIRLCRELEKNMIYDIKQFLSQYPYYALHNDISEWRWDIPAEERLFTVEIERDEDEIERLRQRVIQCREFIGMIDAQQNGITLINNYNDEHITKPSVA